MSFIWIYATIGNYDEFKASLGISSERKTGLHFQSVKITTTINISIVIIIIIIIKRFILFATLYCISIKGVA